MKKYSKSKLKIKRNLKALIVFFALLLILSISFLVFVLVKNNIDIGKVNYSSKDVDDNVAKNSTPIIVNNLVIGSVYENKWVSAEKFFLNSTNKFNIDLDVYTKTGKSGSFSLQEIKKSGNSTSIYATIKKSDYYSEYFAVSKTEKNIKQPTVNLVEENDQIRKTAKKTLGIYRVFNTSMKVESVYEVNFEENGISKIVFVTNEPGKSMGAYSAVIYIAPNGSSKIIKYSYVRNVKKSSDWPVYSLCFIADLNNDGKSDIVLQETREFNIKYDVIEYNNKNFVEVLSTEFTI